MKNLCVFRNLIGVFIAIIHFIGCSTSNQPAAPTNASAFNNFPLAKAGQCIEPPSGLISWWPGDGNAADVSGNNHGTLHNGAAFAPGMVNEAFSFDGMDDIITVGTNGFPLGNAARSVALWVKIDPGDYLTSAFSYGSENWGQGFAVFPAYWGPPSPEPNGTLQFTAFGSGNDLFTGISIRDNQWHHVAVTYDGNALIIYLDGAPVASRSIVLSTGTASGACIGARCVGHTFLTGGVDEVAIWNRDLTASEIQSLFVAGSAGMCKDERLVTICHKPGTPAEKTLSIPLQALAGHLAHGDEIGACK